jgi:hypothetical protein
MLMTSAELSKFIIGDGESVCVLEGVSVEERLVKLILAQDFAMVLEGKIG